MSSVLSVSRCLDECVSRALSRRQQKTLTQILKRQTNLDQISARIMQTTSTLTGHRPESLILARRREMFAMPQSKDSQDHLKSMNMGKQPQTRGTKRVLDIQL